MATIVTSKNNIEIISYSCPGMHHTELSVYLRYGSMYETDCQNGTAHFYEHILFRNLNKLYGGDFYHRLDLNCIDFNAATYKELIQITVKFLPRCTDFVLDILEKIFSPIVLTADEISAERNRIRAEIRESSTWDLEDEAAKTVWRDTTLANPVLGTRGSIAKIRKKQLVEAHRKIFSAGNILVCLTGNVPDELLSKAKAVLEQQNCTQDVPFRDNIAPVPKDFGNRSCKIVSARSDDARMRLSFDFDCKKIEKPCRNLLYDTMFIGDFCKFYQQLSEKTGLVYSYDSYLGEYRNIGTFSVFLEYANGDFLSVLREIVKILNEIKRGDFDLSCTRANYILGNAFILDNPNDLNWELVFPEKFLGTDYTFADKARIYDNITKEQIMYAAREIFTTDNLVAVFKNKATEADLQAAREIFAELDVL